MVWGKLEIFSDTANVGYNYMVDVPNHGRFIGLASE